MWWAIQNQDLHEILASFTPNIKNKIEKNNYAHLYLIIVWAYLGSKEHSILETAFCMEGQFRKLMDALQKLHNEFPPNMGEL